jgi:hypothetical protein
MLGGAACSNAHRCAMTSLIATLGVTGRGIGGSLPRPLPTNCGTTCALSLGFAVD